MEAKRRVAVASSVVVVVAAVLATSAAVGSAAPGFKVCDPPSGTFYTSLRVKGVGCKKARFILTHAKCRNEICSKFGRGNWGCTVKGDIAIRTTRCKNGKDRIVATASGD